MSDSENLLEQPIKANLRFMFSSVPVTDGLRIRVPPLTADYGDAYLDGYTYAGWPSELRLEELDTCYFAVDLSKVEIGVEQPMVELPEGFYCREFLDVNPCDLGELFDFQKKWGRIHGARALKPDEHDDRKRARPEPDQHIFQGNNVRYHNDQLVGIQASARLFDEVPDEEYVSEDELCKLTAVSFREAVAAVIDAQNAIRALIRVLQDDRPVMTVKELTDAKSASDYVSRFLPRVFPSLELLAVDEKTGATSHSMECDLITSVFAQLARGLLNNEAYRVCANPECGRLFTPREMGRRLDTKYCCSACQERAKRLRYVARHFDVGIV